MISWWVLCLFPLQYKIMIVSQVSICQPQKRACLEGLHQKGARRFHKTLFYLIDKTKVVVRY